MTSHPSVAVHSRPIALEFQSQKLSRLERRPALAQASEVVAGLNTEGHNLGFLDQRFALDWVQRNTHAFGGSKDKVTIFGESAGAFSVDALLTSFPANSTPPFRGAILQSGQYSYRSSRTANATQAQVPWDDLSAALGCPGFYGSNLTCVRAANASAIKNIIEQRSLAFDPIPDGVTLVRSPAQQRLSGNIATIPVLCGTNAQEGQYGDFSGVQSPLNTANMRDSVFAVGQTNFSAYVFNLFPAEPALVSAIVNAYPLGGSSGLSSGYDQISAFSTDYVFTCPQAKWANDTASIGIPAWRYYFNASFANTQAYPGLGVYHSSEIPIVFGTYTKTNVTTQEYALSNSMMSVWARFAKNPAGGPGWNAVGTGLEGPVLVGAGAVELNGLWTRANGSVLNGTWDLGLFGNRGDALGAGVTVVEQSEVDGRCALLEPIYAAINSLL